MPATIILGASLKILLNYQADIVAESGSTVREVLNAHGIKPELVALVSVNGEMQSKDYVIQDKDVVRLLAVVGGG